jgi:WD40 repeat protein/serine/threonine protein kinase
MSHRLTCLQGHQWDVPLADGLTPTAEPTLCPVCGGSSQTHPDLAGLEAFLAPAEELPVAPPAERSEATTLGCPPVPPAQQPRRLPRVAGYELVAELGRGAMGVVYQAVQCKAQRTVALKMILAGAHAGPRELARFRSEAEAAAGLQHPHIVQIFEVNEQDGQPFFSMEFVPGGTLAEKLAGTPLPAREAAALVATLADAVHAAHQHGIIHRDLKPANILLSSNRATDQADGESVRNIPGARLHGCEPKITDFGLAKQVHGTSGLTDAGAVLGTPSYMAPEQAGGKLADLGPATDIYALGAILYETLTGRPPFQAAQPVDTILQVLSVEPIRPTRLQPQLPRDVETICLKCLEKEPRKRYASARALAADLQRFLADEPILARPTPFWERAAKWARRQPVVATLLAIIIVTALLSFGLITREWQTAVTARREAVAERGKAEALLIRLSLDRGQTLCEQGEVARGLLWLGRALILIPPGDENRLRAVRGDLGAWSQRLRPLRRLLGHPGAVRSAAFAPDGRTVLTICGDHVARLWAVDTGETLALLEHAAPVTAAAWSPNGEQVATGDEQGEVHLWQTTAPFSGKACTGHHGPIQALAFSADSKTLATGSRDCTMRLWKTATAEPLCPLLPHRDPIQAIAFRPDGKVVLAGTGDQVRFRDALTGKLLETALRCPGGEVWALVFSPDGKTLLTSTHGQMGSERTAVQLWDPATAALRASLPHRYWVKAVVFSPDSHKVLTGSEDHTAQLWDTATGKPLGKPLQHHDWVEAVAFSPDGATLLTGSTDQTARLWMTATGRPLGQPLEHQGPVETVAFAPDGRTLLTAGRDQFARLWENTPVSGPDPRLAHADDVMAVAVSPNGRLILTGSADHTARLWDRVSGKPIDPATAQPLPVFTHQDEVWTVAFSADGRLAATGGKDRTAQLWDVATGRRLHRLPHDHWVRALAFSPDGRTLLTGSGDRTSGLARLWDVATGAPVGEPLAQDGVVWAVAFSPDGKRVALGVGDSAARLWDLATRKPFGAPLQHQNRVVAVAFSKDGRLVVTGSTDQTARLWDAATGLPKITEPLEHGGAVWAVAFGPEDQSVLTAGRGPGVRLWDTVTGTAIGPPWSHAGVVWSVAMSPDGHTVVTGGEDNVARLWELPPILDGDIERLGLWIQVSTGLELEPDGSHVRFLSADDWQQRRQRLQELGGPP